MGAFEAAPTLCEGRLEQPRGFESARRVIDFPNLEKFSAHAVASLLDVKVGVLTREVKCRVLGRQSGGISDAFARFVEGVDGVGKFKLQPSKR